MSSSESLTTVFRISAMNKSVGFMDDDVHDPQID